MHLLPVPPLLIDPGCPPMLISSDLVKTLCLKPCQLYKSLTVLGAFMKNKRNMDSNIVLSQYCKLSPDSVSKACTINAIICPGLHTDLILGLEFLVKNKIVVNVELRTAIAKETRYDLLNPPDSKIFQKKVCTSPFQKWKQEAQLIRLGQSDAKKT